MAKINDTKYLLLDKESIKDIQDQLKLNIDSMGFLVVDIIDYSTDGKLEYDIQLKGGNQ